MFQNLFAPGTKRVFLCLWDQDIARLAFWRYAHPRLHTVWTCQSSPLQFLCSLLLGHKERDVHTAAHNFTNIISWCSLATQQVFTQLRVYLSDNTSYQAEVGDAMQR